MLLMDTQNNLESTNDTINPRFIEGEDRTQSNRVSSKVLYSEPIQIQPTPSFGTKMTNNFSARPSQSKLVKNTTPGFRMTFNKNNQ